MSVMRVEDLSTALVLVLALYAAPGLAFAFAFSWRGASRLDPAAQDMPIGARLLLVPGALALWPWLLLRWRQAVRQRGTR